ncbi:hypothetical protein IQ17_05696 [Bradyrhizobium daqingense]|uniref:Sulfur globule protein n=1 Tax=Bradyrhizobium daqingense TaxID=993502 RepID=A0A562KTT4_9BRAD|nr:hypothetical protein IQ17_05696 [Bradyrhizobium daqingense]
MLRKMMIAVLAVAAVGLSVPQSAEARGFGHGGWGHGGGWHGGGWGHGGHWRGGGFWPGVAIGAGIAGAGLYGGYYGYGYGYPYYGGPPIMVPAITTMVVAMSPGSG